MEQRLQRVFQQSYQVKRAIKEVEFLKEAKGKMGLQLRYLTRGNIQFVITVEITKQKLLQIKKLSYLDKIQFKIVLNKEYPSAPPPIYFLNQNVIQLGINPFHNYIKCLAPGWTPKTSILDIVKLVPAFLIQCIQKSKSIIGEPSLFQYFQVQKLFSFRDCQVFPVKLVKNKVTYQGMIAIVNRQEIVIFQQSPQFASSYNNIDFIQITEIFSAQKHKTKHLRALLQIRRNGKRFGVEFSSDEYDTIIDIIVQKMKMMPLGQAQISQDEQDSDEQLQEYKKQKQFTINNSNINQVESQILILQSLVQTNPTTSSIKQLVALLQKAVEYYSVLADSRCQIHLKSLQSIMGNQFLQTLLVSENVESKHQKNQYQSISNYM